MFQFTRIIHRAHVPYFSVLELQSIEDQNKLFHLVRKDFIIILHFMHHLYFYFLFRLLESNDQFDNKRHLLYSCHIVGFTRRC